MRNKLAKELRKAARSLNLTKGEYRLMKKEISRTPKPLRRAILDRKPV